MTIMLVVANFVADLIIVWLDPRISHAPISMPSPTGRTARYLP